MKQIENFSLWVDFLEREFISSDLKKLVDSGRVRGATSNPAIFKNAFSISKAYEQQKLNSSAKGKDLYEELAITDIQNACDCFSGIYNEKKEDGFVSLEVDPYFSNDSQATIEEGLSLAKRINRKNLMIKVPATKEGFVAMEELLREGINVNATLIFSDEQTKSCVEAYKKAGNSDVCMVVSVFISRFDRVLDELKPLL